MKSFWVALAVVFTTFFLSITIAMIVWMVQWDIDCGGRLQRAANANTVELAQKELDAAIESCRAQKTTEGYTSVFWRTPDEDIGFWFTNICAARDELASLPKTASPLEKSNMLMKLRETLTDAGENGKQKLVVPDGISRYPRNGLIGTAFWASLLLGALAWFMVAVWWEQ